VPAIPLPDPELRDEVVRLREPAPEDVPALYEACQDPLIQRFTFVPQPYEAEHARQWVAQAPGLRERGEGLSLVVADAETGALLGTVGLLRPRWEHRAAEIGYFVAPWARGRGAASRAARLLARWAVTDLGLARLTCEVDIENQASQTVARRAGFVREGVLRSAIEAKGRRWTLVVHSLLPEDLT
jgi:RimJ/RimL family protein N-acetyltransferase